MIIEGPVHEPHAYRLGELLVGGDIACENGDTATLAHLAEQLCVCLAEPLRAQLVQLVHTCHTSDDHALDDWDRVRALIRSSLRRPDVDSAPH
jgi:hypothetical protein